MQSNFVVFCRALVMLIAVIGLPALAIWGLDRPLPPIVNHWIGRIKSQITGIELASAEHSNAPSALAGEVPYQLSSGTNDSTNPPLLAVGGPSSADRHSSELGGAGDRQAMQASASVPADQSLAPASDAVSPSDQMLEIEQQLRARGANRYLLERWGVEKRLYRFRCEMPFAGRAGFHQHFEATADTALAAMTDVLAKVDAWRTASAERGGVIRR